MPYYRKKETSQIVEKGWAEFVGFLRQRGDRITHSRYIVFRRVLGQAEHFRADDLAARLISGPDRVSRGTVYRTLGLMVEAGFVRKVRGDDRHSHYEPVYGRGRHEHMICNRCGGIIEFEEPKIEPFIAEKCRELGFSASGYRVTVTGCCSNCKKDGAGLE